MKGARIQDLYILQEPGPRVMLTLFGERSPSGRETLPGTLDALVGNPPIEAK